MSIRTLKILCILFSILTVLAALGYVNSNVSYKYEVQTEGISPKHDSEKHTSEDKGSVNKQTSPHEKAILRDIKVSSYLFWIFLVTSIIIAYAIVFNKGKMNTNK